MKKKKITKEKLHRHHTTDGHRDLETNLSEKALVSIFYIFGFGSKRLKKKPVI